MHNVRLVLAKGVEEVEQGHAGAIVPVWDRRAAPDPQAVAVDRAGDSPKALDYFEKALPIRLKSLGPEHPHVSSIQNSINIVKEKLNK